MADVPTSPHDVWANDRMDRLKKLDAYRRNEIDLTGPQLVYCLGIFYESNIEMLARINTLREDRKRIIRTGTISWKR